VGERDSGVCLTACQSVSFAPVGMAFNSPSDERGVGRRGTILANEPQTFRDEEVFPTEVWSATVVWSEGRNERLCINRKEKKKENGQGEGRVPHVVVGTTSKEGESWSTSSNRASVARFCWLGSAKNERRSRSKAPQQFCQRERIGEGEDKKMVVDVKIERNLQEVIHVPLNLTLAREQCRPEASRGWHLQHHRLRLPRVLDPSPVCFRSSAPRRSLQATS
jgi:hypothetical protein